VLFTMTCWANKLTRRNRPRHRCRRPILQHRQDQWRAVLRVIEGGGLGGAIIVNLQAAVVGITFIDESGKNIPVKISQIAMPANGHYASVLSHRSEAGFSQV